jgi:hypothetical protein
VQAERESRCEVLPHLRTTPTNREGGVPYFYFKIFYQDYI